jgi:hypothetical protein
MEAHMYKNLRGNSGVRAYKLSAHEIVVYFTNGVIYSYTYDSAGKKHIEKMKALAKSGKGLATYINKYVHDSFSEKLN